MKWDNLTAPQYQRLCECKSKKTDIIPIAKAYMREKGYDSEQAIEVTLEQLDANGQFFDLSHEEWVYAVYALNVWDNRQKER